VTDAGGFTYRWDAEKNQYAHPAAIYLVTPDGRMARYLYGLGFDPEDLTLGLLDASQGKTLSVSEKFLIYCYQYDPKTHKYAIAAMNIMRLGGVVTMAVLGGLLFTLWRRERRRKNKTGDDAHPRDTDPAEARP
jgi:protein SCO1/2